MANPTTEQPSSRKVPDSAAAGRGSKSSTPLIGFGIFTVGLYLFGSQDGGTAGSHNSDRELEELRGSVVPAERVTWIQSPDFGLSALDLNNASIRYIHAVVGMGTESIVSDDPSRCLSGCTLRVVNSFLRVRSRDGLWHLGQLKNAFPHL